MNTEYILDVIHNIKEICDSSTVKELKLYLNELDEDTIIMICAMMDFGRHHLYKVMPINLDKYFNRYMLPFWTEKNRSEGKDIAISYLSQKKLDMLSMFILRAKELLIDNNECNINMKHDCNGDLVVEDVDGILQVGPDEFELNLKCLNCDSRITKMVTEYYLEKRI